jgi:hypothetical protein
MEPDLCPPWWPAFLWWLLHHHHPVPPSPDPEEWLKKLREPVEDILTGLAIYTQSQAWVGPKEEGLRGEMQQTALTQMNRAMEQLTEMAQAQR